MLRWENASVAAIDELNRWEALANNGSFLGFSACVAVFHGFGVVVCLYVLVKLDDNRAKANAKFWATGILLMGHLSRVVWATVDPFCAFHRIPSQAQVRLLEHEGF